MVDVSRDATDEEIFELVYRCVDQLASEDYDAVFESVGYAMRYDRPGAKAIRDDIQRYRSSRYFPGVEQFKVTDWRTAKGGNPTPASRITWYKPNDMGLVAAIDFDLPLNGKWSALNACFVIFQIDGGGYSLALEDIESSQEVASEGAA